MDTLLSETGMQQGEAAGRYLTDITFNNVFVSNLQRAVQVIQTHLYLIWAEKNEHGYSVELSYSVSFI